MGAALFTISTHKHWTRFDSFLYFAKLHTRSTQLCNSQKLFWFIKNIPNPIKGWVMFIIVADKNE